jgi:hypothetical protein
MAGTTLAIAVAIARPAMTEEAAAFYKLPTDMRHRPIRDARPSARHPRPVSSACSKPDVDSRDKPGHDGGEFSADKPLMKTTRDPAPVMPALVAGIHVLLILVRQQARRRRLGQLRNPCGDYSAGRDGIQFV